MLNIDYIERIYFLAALTLGNRNSEVFFRSRLLRGKYFLSCALRQMENNPLASAVILYSFPSWKKDGIISIGIYQLFQESKALANNITLIIMVANDMNDAHVDTPTSDVLLAKTAHKNDSAISPPDNISLKDCFINSFFI